jgi:hypothetical protein
LNHAINMSLQCAQRFTHGRQLWRIADRATRPVQVMIVTPSRRARCPSLAYTGQLLFDAPCGGRVEALVNNLRQRNQLIVSQVANLSAFQYRPTQLLGRWLLFTFQLSHRVNRTGEHLETMKPVHSDRRIRQVLVDAADKRWGHVTHHFEHLLRVTTMGRKKMPQTAAASLFPALVRQTALAPFAGPYR